ncbi:cyclase family protein [Persicobacter diffluens]|uniref:Cyclase n=1 Tax=Persicobacter diffluens TaxID=981 RepID=A0AAN4W2H5_9BACT|nr:cyclase [Persicobacter diffluens]
MKTPLLLFLLCCLLLSCQVEEEETIQKPSPSKEKLVDLSHDFSKETVYWVTEPDFQLDSGFHGETEKGYYYAANSFCAAEHGGTHIDAPIHFSKTGQTVDQLPLEKLAGPAIKIDIKERALQSPDYLISIEDLMQWESQQGHPIPDQAIILLETGYAKYYGDKKKYLGTINKGPEAVKELHFPGLAPEAAQWLVDERNINAVGIDTPSIDYGQSTHFQSHVILLGQQIPVFENVNLSMKLPAEGFDIMAFPMKIKGGSGAPLRIVARIRE